jgi:CarD family transcriptional regulator
VKRGFSLSSTKFSFRKNEATESVKVSQTQTEFKVGDNAVYPGHGVGTVMAIETKEISGKKLEFYVVQMKETGMRVLVPKGNTSSVGLRPVISKAEAERVMSILRDHPVKMDHQTWNRRYREYMEKIRTGSIYEIAEVLRALFVLRADKELSYGEKNMLENARRLIMVELSLAVEKSELESRPEMREMLGL